MTPRAHEVKVRDVVAETGDAVTVSFDIPEDLAPRFRYQPGQFLTVRVPSDRTGSVARCYSLSSSPHCEDRLAVTVKRTAGGYGSNWICDNLESGDLIGVLEPAGVFTPRSLDEDLLLFAAGSGVTPIMSIAKSVLAAGTGDVVVVYANRDADAVIFGNEFDRLTQRFPQRLTVRHWLENERGLPTVAGLVELARDHRDHDVFLCGPTGFTAVTLAALGQLGIPEQRVHREQYRSLTDNPFEHTAPAATPTPTGAGKDTATVRVEIDGETHMLNWPRDTKLLDMLLDHGIDAPYVCRESACGTCVCSVKSGRTRMLMNESLIDDELAAGLTLACQTLPESDQLHIAFDQ
ncbi:ferredoxin--NADP reductase [Nocardia uniformis]|uniref:Ferredoxin--NADP reductase n=1 Tax=Nocardia uniformis TaxID=53432 RepID=A0A849C232_9NOCA|nr:ferredoxin--NADP reductase [Nocardia uniformis]NNH72772.1 ferredoxin--NADP reductase [Nocardia uniformis]